MGNNIENLISLLAGQTISKGNGEYNPVGDMSTNIAPMEVSFELNATGSRTEFAGDSAGAQTYSYTYTDPVEGDEE